MTVWNVFGNLPAKEFAKQKQLRAVKRVLPSNVESML